MGGKGSQRPIVVLKRGTAPPGPRRADGVPRCGTGSWNRTGDTVRHHRFTAKRAKRRLARNVENPPRVNPSDVRTKTRRRADREVTSREGSRCRGGTAPIRALPELLPNTERYGNFVRRRRTSENGDVDVGRESP